MQVNAHEIATGDVPFTGDSSQFHLHYGSVSAFHSLPKRFLVTSRNKYAICTSVRTYSTQQAAKKVGIHWVTLHRWLAAKKVRPTIAVPMDAGRTLWRWTEKDIAKLEKLKKATYRKGRGRKPKGKKKRLK